LGEDASTTSVVLSFTLALLVWGWLEMGYLIGWITGPRQRPCSPNASLATRLREGLGTCLYHELALLLLLGLLLLLSWGAPNQTSLLAFAVLWGMRWSAKLNLVLGVRNYNSNWLPDHLEYLDSYIPRRRMNPLFPLSLIAGIALTAWLASLAATAPTLAAQVSYTLAASLAALGTLEHLFLMLPLRDALLWQWAAPSVVSVSAELYPQEQSANQH
jgi:putative photosynthetic complex assembly protein 2